MKKKKETKRKKKKKKKKKKISNQQTKKKEKKKKKKKKPNEQTNSKPQHFNEAVDIRNRHAPLFFLRFNKTKQTTISVYLQVITKAERGF